MDAFSGRRIHDYLAYHYFVDPPSPKGIGNTTGHNWSVQRRFGVRTLRHLGGFGKASLESLMAPEIDRLVAGWLKNSGGQGWKLLSCSQFQEFGQ